MSNNLMKKKLQGKVAIVTGGASGIGETTARALADHGALAVVIADIQPEKGRAVAESIGLQRCTYVHCDVADEEQVAAMIEWTATTYGGLDVMFSNAGILAGSPQTILELDFSEYERVMRVNARGVAVCVKHAARKMVELGTRGAIICTASTAAEKAKMDLTDYIMSKRAVLGLMRSASLQLGKHGIRVNSVSMGAVPTPLSAKHRLVTAADVDKYIGPYTSLKGTTLTGENVADAVAFLASDEAAFVTGVDLAVDGGLIAIPFDLSN
ncbi:(-)-isopiperitenol/(-)-carveol dehydrogenase, mitochondrial-like [Salvia hispanica]|uniref:(-)-isopiperitenol/(-)-carveol dehydrogenase, mitochondrial-like n=1 Tax=Salvia hispanica TaxID=49212 RepID=UPI0020095237|nr:(-)-isopiperitenol/(-)-carveol dehydrogenase, mitochondrial-like [Salvia hispanica]